MDIWDKIEKLIDSREDNEVIKPPKKTVKSGGNRGIIRKIVITRKGTYVDADPTAEKKIQGYLRIKTRNILGYDNITNAYYYQGKRMYIPRFAAFLLKKKWGEFNIEYKIPKPTKLDLVYKGTLTPNQRIILDSLTSQFHQSKNGETGAIIKLAAGQGKTFLGMGLIGTFKTRTLIVCHNENILRQWGELLEKYIEGATVGYHYGKKKKPGDIIVSVINSLTIVEPEFFEKFDTVLLDEVHQYCSTVRREIYKHCQATYMIGLSATPDEREDKLDKINVWNVGPIFHAEKLDSFHIDETQFSCKVFRVKYYGPDEYTETILNEKLDLVSVPKMLDQLSRDPHRLKLIVEIIQDLVKRSRNIFVFADRRGYLEAVQNELEKVGQESVIETSDEPIDEKGTIQLVGGSTHQDVQNAMEKNVVILSTYQYGATGLSIPKMDTLVLITPRKTNSRQICGRIFRLGGDQSIQREIYDIVDMKTTLKNQYYSRTQYYKENNFEILEIVKKIV